jgi:hypothetical protein
MSRKSHPVRGLARICVGYVRRWKLEGALSWLRERVGAPWVGSGKLLGGTDQERLLGARAPIDPAARCIRKAKFPARSHATP